MWNHITVYHCLLGAFSTTTGPQWVQHHILIIMIQLKQLLQWLYQHPRWFLLSLYQHLGWFLLSFLKSYYILLPMTYFVIINEWVSDDYSSLVNISSAMSWREQLTLDQIIIMYAFFQTIALKVRHVAPLGHIIPTLKQPICLCPFSLMMFA